MLIEVTMKDSGVSFLVNLKHIITITPGRKGSYLKTSDGITHEIEESIQELIGDVYEA